MALIEMVFPKKVPPPIRIYDADETSFLGNGLRCLIPETAEITLKENQAYSLHMTHPIDAEGVWRMIQNARILLVPIMYRGVMKYQPMRIYKVQKQRQSGGRKMITVDAKHVFYDLNDVIVETCQISSAACQDAIDSVFNSIFEPTANPQASAPFSYSSDIASTADADYSYITVTAALIGNDNSIASLYGAELYVDAFRFSLNSRMEGAIDNAFDLTYGINLIGITATYSTENTYSAVVGQATNSAQTLVRTVDPATISLPHDRTIFAKFSYKSGTPESKFSDDMDAYSADKARVDASYQVSFADLPQTDEYADFANLATYEVGDTGRVYDADLDIDTVQKIVEKKVDVLTQTAISATLGSIPASITQQRAYANTVTNNMTAEDKANTVLGNDIAKAFAEMTAMLLPKKTASGAPPLTFTTGLAAPIEAWAVYGAAGGAGIDRSGTITIAVSVNGAETVAVAVPQKLYAGDFIRRLEGGTGILHLENDSSGNPLSDPVESSITMPVIIMTKGAKTVTVAGTVQPSSVEIVYR